MSLEIRDIRKNEYTLLGALMVDVYTDLEGFPSPDEQPAYYEMLKNIGRFSEQDNTQVLVAIAADNTLVGGVIYFSDMTVYGSGGTATAQTNASGIRLLGVDAKARGLGVGKALTNACIDLAKGHGHAQVILHTTRAMQTAWKLYEKLGFRRSPDLDFMQKDLPVFGFRLLLNDARA